MSRKSKRPADFEAGDQGINLYLKAAMLEVVENQLRENNPPETQQMRHAPAGGGVYSTGSNRTDWIGGGGRNLAAVA